MLRLSALILIFSIFQSSWAQTADHCRFYPTYPIQNQSDLVATILNLQSDEVVVDLSNSSCGEFIQKQYGLSAKSICLSKKKLFFCSEGKAPYGAEIPDAFLKHFNIDVNDLESSLKRTCPTILKTKTKIAKSCQLSDYALFNELVYIGIPIHTCFCQDSASKPVLSICVNRQGTWTSTGELDTIQFKSKLQERCRLKAKPEIQRVCDCGSDDQNDLSGFLDCLKQRSSSP